MLLSPNLSLDYIDVNAAQREVTHNAAIRALEERGIKFDLICGTSIGALVGAVYASQQLDQFEQWVTSLVWSKVVRLMDITWKGGLIRGQRLFNLFRATFQDLEISELSTPFGAVATELSSGREIWLREGKLLDIVRASRAMPGLFTPVVRNGTVLVRKRAERPGPGRA